MLNETCLHDYSNDIETQFVSKTTRLLGSTITNRKPTSKSSKHAVVPSTASSPTRGEGNRVCFVREKCRKESDASVRGKMYRLRSIFCGYFITHYNSIIQVCESVNAIVLIVSRMSRRNYQTDCWHFANKFRQLLVDDKDIVNSEIIAIWTESCRSGLFCSTDVCCRPLLD